MTLGISNIMFAQDTEPDTTAADTTVVFRWASSSRTVEMVTEPEPETFHEVLKDQFIQGGPEFMGIVLLTLIFGLAISIERIIYLTLSTTNTKNYSLTLKKHFKLMV